MDIPVNYLAVAMIVGWLWYAAGALAAFTAALGLSTNSAERRHLQRRIDGM